MNKAMKTKDMAQTLGVSQTTVKRWVSHYPDSFRKDRYGHYVFSEQDVERVRHIKLMVEQGMALDEISLSEIGHSMTMETAAAAERTADACGGAFGIADDLQVTIARIEAALSQKADDVVPDLRQGDPDGTGMGGPGYGIAGEFSGNGFPNDLKHERGVISMARAQDPNSAGSQFFIMVADAPYLDGSYAAFGKVTSGMEAVDEIVSLPTGANDRPETLPAMKKVTVDTKGIEYAEPETVK